MAQHFSRPLPRLPAPVRQSAVVAYRLDEHGAIEVLLVSSRSTGRWVVPKGDVKPTLSAAKSAAKEAFEEAGIGGKVRKKALGSYRYFKADDARGRPHDVEVFAMEVKTVKARWPERKERVREWLPVETAARLVCERELRQLILELPQKIEKVE
ncbi:MAG: NUDIX hydrolase [Magnetospirillum sp. WYHS-4]